MVRRIAVGHAGIIYDPRCPRYVRKRNATKSLIAGTEVRVTAELGTDGEWRATKVEILGRRKLPVEDDSDEDEDIDSGPAIHRTAAQRTI